VKRLRRIEKDMSGEAREKFAAFIEDGDIGQARRRAGGSGQERFRQDPESIARQGFPESAGRLPIHSDW